MKPLTERQHEVMQLLCLGHSNKQIAEYCQCSLKTAEKHREAVYYKWGVGSVVALIRVAIRTNNFTFDDFINSRIGEGAYHQMPQSLERVNPK